ncbi:MAG: YccF domain-containing protein [Halolamina sp.]|uniref:YccF domain-containing protein n=1 Tax=Halolamina sp. TaxID=1940283 RepID=UPI002FC3908E
MKEYSLPVQALWFLLIGWWATPVVVNLAVFFFGTIVGIPVGIVLINNVPRVLLLKSKRDTGLEGDTEQHSILVRAVYFLFIGWWLGLLWGNLASLFAITVIGLPVAIWMLNRLPYVVSLYRY